MDGRSSDDTVVVVVHASNEEIRCKVVSHGNKVLLIECDENPPLNGNSRSLERNYSCPHCSVQCEDENDLSNHILTNHDFGIYLNDGNTSNANYIVEVVKNLDDIENDETESNISGNVVESYKCNQCDKDYQTANELDQHNQLHKPYLCEECSQSFATISNLSEHIMSEHDENYRDSFTKCKICSFVAINRRTLLQHMIVHLSIAKLPCKICPEIAPDKDSLWEHFRIKHAELEPAETVEVQQCLTCDATFFEEEEFMEHLKQYRSEAPYKCKYCRSKFYEIKEVETHLNERHSDKTNNAKMCKFCTRLIPLNSFNKHLQLHLDVYFCDLCQRTFTSVDILTQHRLNYHQQAQNVYFIDELRKKDKKYVEEVLHAFEAHEKWESA